MKRQQIRKLILLISLMFLPVTLFYFSPVLIIEGAVVGVITGSALTFIILFFTGMIFGRGACGWIMACGSFQDCLAGVNDKPLRAENKRWIRWTVWGVWISGVAAAMILGHVHTFKPFFMTDHGVSVSRPWMYIIYYGVLAVFAAVALPTGRRGFCAYGCWMSPFMVLGAKFADVLHLPRLKLVKKGEAPCTSCEKCTKICPSSLNVQKCMSKGGSISTECIQCGQCADICPHKIPGFTFTAKR